jgi:hypothetical protein
MHLRFPFSPTSLPQMQQFMKRCAMLVAPVIGALAIACVAPTSANAEVQKHMQICDGKLCPSFTLVLTPPVEWDVDKAASEENRVQMLIPRGTNFHDARAVIYVRVAVKDKDQPLADFIRVSQERWRQSVADAKISKLPPVERGNGKSAFEPFRYENPSRPQQPFEIVAFGTDTDKDGNDFILTVVMSGKDQKAIEQAQNSYLELLRRH